MAHKIVLTTRAIKQIKRLPVEFFRIIGQHIDQLAETPRPVGSIKLANDAGYRIRIGVYRILYDIDDANQTVTIYRVGHRRDIYR